MRIFLWDLESTHTYDDILKMFTWCMNSLGEPGERWLYGKDIVCNSKEIINSPYEIEYIDFKKDEDAVAFKIMFS